MQKWEYLYIGVDFGSNKARYVNGQELRDWKRQSHISTFMGQLGEEGWELVAATDTNSQISPVIIFKRPRP